MAAITDPTGPEGLYPAVVPGGPDTERGLQRGDAALSESADKFATLQGPWAPVQDSHQVGQDEQIRSNEYIVPAGELELVSSPVQFDVTAPELRPGPEFAAQTEEVLLELGWDWERIIELKTSGAVA